MELSNPFGMSRPALFLLLSTHSTPRIYAFLPQASVLSLYVLFLLLSRLLNTKLRDDMASKTISPTLGLLLSNFVRGTRMGSNYY